ncbi:hypothetical protein LEP1GSC104_3862 [Leptospira interrogans str. UI 12621]|uniref:Uncharacterized protein n=1 Tax=Leptospira interrogans str. UI 12621 TaxID=1049937 RepID=A0A0F6HGJ2_LEPIR|nr:hypothetical protein LEP1GSC104_3862 [Leptospira interrogans str. UI 12621]
MLISKLQIHWSDRFHFCHLLHPGYREARKEPGNNVRNFFKNVYV